jgi:hypothetical protein
MSFFSQQALDCVPDNRGTQKNGACQGEDFGLEAVGAVNESGFADDAAEEQHPPCQCPQQGDADADLLAVRVFDGDIVCKMQMFVSHY